MIYYFVLSLLFLTTHCNQIQGLPLRYGSLIRIKSSVTNHFLHSHKVTLTYEGSNSVTGFWMDNDANSLWSVQEPYATSKFSTKSYKDTLQCSDNITLIHSLTGGNLQSFQGAQGLTSPQQLVSNNPKSLESNSNWMIQCLNQKDKQVKFGTKFRLRHLNSNKYLTISKQYVYDDVNCGRGCMIKNHLEINVMRQKTPETVLVAVGGITFIN